MTSHPKSFTTALILIAGLLPYAAQAEDQTKPYWQEPMKTLHDKFDGDPGYVAQLGDSITMSLAFWSPFGWDEPAQYLPDDDLPKNPLSTRWREVLKGFRDKGPGHGNQTGWTSANLNSVVNKVLDVEKPEVAIVMIGTNDIAGGRLSPAYRQHLESIVDACLRHHCIPILDTIPPRRGAQKAAEQVNDVVRAVAREHSVPLVDYYAEILKRRPGKTWDGKLIDKDGIHPSNDNGKTNVYTPENLAVNGYALRNYLDFMAVREVYFRVLHPINE